MMQTEVVAEAAAETFAAKTRFYRPELDVLRFVAFFLVFLCHWIPVKDPPEPFMDLIKNAASMGVPVFFCLSSYLITELLLRERRTTQRINTPAFYKRRALRIWPLYFAALFTGFFFVPAPHKETSGALLSYIFLAGNWYTFFHGYLPLGSSVLWSIGVEEQFYLFWPSVIRFAKNRGIILISAAMLIASQAGLLWLWSRPVVNPRIWVSTFPHLQYFAIGAIVSICFHQKLPRIHTILRLAMIATGLVLFVMANEMVHINPDGSPGGMMYPGYLIVGIGCALLLIGMLGAEIPRRMKPFVYLGKISYGLYIYHVWCLQLSLVIAKALYIHSHVSIFTFALGFPLTVLVAACSYRFFESPFLRLKERFEIVKSRTV